jgi:hypothetical protein
MALLPTLNLTLTMLALTLPPGDAFVLSGTGHAVTKAHIVESTLDHLSSLGVEWIYQTRLRLLPTEMFDIGFVAHCFGLKESHLANFVYEAIETTLSTARRRGGAG